MTAKYSVSMDRRKVLTIVGLSVTGAALIPEKWVSPVVNSVLLPAHAQTSMCVTDDSLGGPLVGNGFGATTCQEACEAQAADVGAQLCAVTETVDALGATQCGCDIDRP